MNTDTATIQTFEHDVVIIGAGGAGLRAAIECSAQGLDTAVVCKSLLGKAHTVMAAVSYTHLTLTTTPYV